MKLFLILQLLWLLAGSVEAQTKPADPLTPAQKSAIESALRTEMNDSRTPGAALAIIRNNQVIYENSFGRSNNFTKTPVTDSTLFQIGSVSKIFTSLALLSELKRTGTDVQDPIGETIKGLSPGLSRLTFHQLLSHTSGMVDFWPGPDACNQEVYPFFEKRGDSLLFAKPGEVFSYCNIGYALAGLALEKISGKSFTEAINDIIFKPLQLSHTTYDFYSVACTTFSSGHILDRGSQTVFPFILNVSCPLIQAAGGAYSTIQDLERVAICLMNKGELDGKQVFDKSLIESMIGRYAEHFTTSSFGFATFPDNAYGYGMFSFDFGKLNFIGNIGIASQMTYLMCDPGKKFAIILLSNLQMDMLVDSFKKICEVVMGETLPPATALDYDPAESREIAGSYLLHAIDPAGEATTDILEKNGRLYIRLPGAGDTELTRTGAWEYRFTGQDTRFPGEVRFEKDTSGKVRFMRYYWGSWVKRS